MFYFQSLDCNTNVLQTYQFDDDAKIKMNSIPANRISNDEMDLYAGCIT